MRCLSSQRPDLLKGVFSVYRAVHKLFNFLFGCRREVVGVFCTDELCCFSASCPCANREYCHGGTVLACEARPSDDDDDDDEDGDILHEEK